MSKSSTTLNVNQEVSFEEQYQRIKKKMDELTERMTSFYNEHFTVQTREGQSAIGGDQGVLICKHCGKEYIWNEWGASMTRAFRWAFKHAEEKHQTKLVWIFAPNDWCYKWFLKTIRDRMGVDP